MAQLGSIFWVLRHFSSPATSEPQPKIAFWVLFFPLYKPDRQQLAQQVEDMAPHVSSYNLEGRAHGPLCFSLRVLMDTHPDISLHSIRMGPKPQTNKTKEMGATGCLKARGPEVLLQQSLCRRELAVLTVLVRDMCPSYTPQRRGVGRCCRGLWDANCQKGWSADYSNLVLVLLLITWS